MFLEFIQTKNTPILLNQGVHTQFSSCRTLTSHTIQNSINYLKEYVS